ncbi:MULTISPECIES: ABC transporter substrate-binding protein [Paenibacillus]|uniref:Sugar ABC transporter substrate-binding protein n=1 Tax=Paenibacillus azoreducens TaxID=116718 RepID=A0A919YCR5_9BACL|nr:MULTISPECIES: sugar ABC transporter substrate-binding protein [Paenibacillus]MBE9915068.1 sugar ABC transporter substrate-binding protein [Paenibacillus donghaensis]GIO49236.1 sugar ABC transporter substrate-binding protein [Paenibacillus azoreducens]
MKKSKKRTVSVLLSVLLLSFLLSACGGGKSGGEEGGKSAGPVKLEFWTISLQPTFTDYFNKLIADYQKSHEGVTIEWKDYPYDAVTNKLLTSIASGSSPDVVNLNTEFASQMGSKGAVVDLNSFLTDEQKQSYFEGIYNSTVIDGKAYALPWYTGTEVLFMNTKIVKDAGLDPANPPKTQDELAAWAKQIKEKTGKSGYARQWVSNLFPREGIKLLNDDKSAAAFNTPETKTILEDIKQKIADGIIVKEDVPFTKQIQYYSSEQVAFEMSGPTFINFLKTSAPDVYKNTIAVPLPTGRSGVRLSNSMNLVVPAKSKHQKEAVEFAAFVTNAENQTSFAKAANTLPSTKESIKDPFFTESDNSLESQAKITSANSLDKAIDYMVGVPNATDINAAIARGLQKIMLNDADINATLDAMEQEVNQVLKK